MPIRIIQEAPPPMSTGEDVARSAGTGAVQGGAGVIGGAGDLAGFLSGLPVAGAQFLENRGWAPKGSAATTERVIRQQDLSPGGIIASAIKGGAPKAVEAAGGDPEAARRTARLVGGIQSLPTTQDVEKATGVDKHYHTPQTKLGKYVRTAAQFAPAAVSPGSAGRRIAQVLVPAAASETAGQMTEGTEMEPYARVAAALVGGAGTAMAGRPHPTTRMLADASRGASDEQIAMARALREDAGRRGVTLTQAEAVQQVTGNGTGMGRVQRVIEGTRAGSEQLDPVMAARPAQVRGAVGQFADEIAPAAPDPYTFGQRAQEAAGETLTGVRQQINANARPWYQALETERMPPTPAAQQLAQTPAYQEALQAVRGNDVLNGPIAHLPNESLAVVNEVVKQLDTLAENARPNPAASTGNAQMAAAYDSARSQADELASAYSEPWRLARSMVASGREAFLEPLQAGPLGAISRAQAQAGGVHGSMVGSQTRALYPSAPPEGAAAPTAQALEMLPQDVSAGLTRQHLMNTLNESTQNLQSGPNQWGGARYAATIAGNPEQRAVLEAGVGAAGGDQQNLRGLLDALEATGKRQAPGSKTAYNTEDLRRLGEAGAAGEAVKAVASGPSMFRRFGEGLQDWQTERNARGLADALLADPARAQEILLEARRRVPPGAALDEIERLALTVNQARLAAPEPVQ